MLLTILWESDMNDFGMTYETFMNALEMNKCSEKRPVSRVNNMAMSKSGNS